MRTLVILSLLICFGCTSPQPGNNSLPENVEAISLLGDTLFTPHNELAETISSRIDSLLSVAEDTGDEVSVTVWNARMQGYRGEYRAAIQTLSESLNSEIAENPIAKATLLRHRGHRYISTRQFDLAISDFEKAASLVDGTDDIVEPDGLPNAQNIPLSSLHTNIFYHLGLAYYLTGDFERAASTYRKCVTASTNNDMMVAALYWEYMSLKKQGKNDEANTILEQVSPEMEIIENGSYHTLLLVFKGETEPDLLLSGAEDALSNATLGYGIGFWHLANGNTEEAFSVWQQVYDAGNWAAFGYIASEAELASR